jgi:hypothetical protein
MPGTLEAILQAVTSVSNAVVAVAPSDEQKMSEWELHKPLKAQRIKERLIRRAIRWLNKHPNTSTEDYCLNMGYEPNGAFKRILDANRITKKFSQDFRTKEKLHGLT